MGLGELQEEIVGALGPKVADRGESCGDFWLQMEADHWLAVVDALRAPPFLFLDLVDICGMDNLGKTPRFEVVAHLYSRDKKERIRLVCRVPDSTLTIPSLVSRWPGANWHEREAFDQYGIRFEGHPNLTRILNAPDLSVFPQRKDHPLKGEREEKEDL